MLNESDFERSLRSLRPKTADVNPERIAYEAGRASVRTPPVWPALTGAATLLATVLGIMLWNRPAPRVIREVVVVREPAPKAEATDQSTSSDPSRMNGPENPIVARTIFSAPTSVRTRDVALRLGVDALGSPTSRAVPNPPLRSGDLYRRNDPNDPAQPIHPSSTSPWSIQ